MKKIIVKNKRTKELKEFICFSTLFPEHFIYRIQPVDNAFDMGRITDYDVVGSLTWDEIQQIEVRNEEA